MERLEERKRDEVKGGRRHGKKKIEEERKKDKGDTERKR
jgi:hypothetical protein